MSHAVPLTELAATSKPYGRTPFLLYAGDDGSARVNHVVVDVVHVGDQVEIRCTGFGRGVPGRVEQGARLSVLWPAIAPGEFSLIADGQARLEEESEILVIDADSAVLHRPAPVDGEGTC